MRKHLLGDLLQKNAFLKPLSALLVLFMLSGCAAGPGVGAQNLPVGVPVQVTPALAATSAPVAAATAPVATEVSIYRVPPRSPDVTNILLLGTDSRSARGTTVGGNADTIILASFNRASNVVTLVSFMRDAVLPISGEYGKLKTAYRTGGPGLIINTLNEFFLLDIQGYVVIGLDGFASFVEQTLGGLDVTLDQSEIDDINARILNYQNEIDAVKNCPLVTSAPGLVHLNGVQTLLFVRNRTTPVHAAVGEASDYDRADRQQEVLALMFHKLVAQEPITAIPGLVSFALKHVETNLSAEALYALAEPLMSESVTMEGVSVPFEGMWEYGGDASGILFDQTPTVRKLHARLYGWND